MAHSSPPPPSFHLPPLNSSGHLPLTPSPTPSPTEEHDARLGSASTLKGKRKEIHIDADGNDPAGRVSMYVRLFDEMIHTVLQSEEYLFDAREAWVLRHIQALPYEPRYLLTRLLLRRPAKIHPLSALQITYSPELGEEGVRRAILVLADPLRLPQEVIDAEPAEPPVPAAGPSLSSTPLRPTKSYPTPGSSSSRARSKARAESVSSVLSKGRTTPAPSSKKRKRPWADLPTGLSAEEEAAEPELAEAIRESLWASQIQRIEVDEDGREIATPPPVRPNGSRSVSDSSTDSSKSGSSAQSKTGSVASSVAGGRTGPLGADWEEPFSLEPARPAPIDRLGRDERDLTLEEIMTCIPADELRKVARARQVPLARLSTRAACEAALCGLARSQSTLGFTPLGKRGARMGQSSPTSTPTAKSKGARQPTLPFGAKRVTSETLLISTLLPYLANHALQLSPSLHALIARVNLIYTRTPPPTTAQPASLMLPSILVQSHKRRYPDYGSPARSRIWESRAELLLWERAVYWETKVSDALGENWADMGRPGGESTLGGGAGRFGREMLGRQDGARIVKRIWEGVEPIWREITAQREKEEREGTGRKRGLCGDRFEVGHVLTRIMYKGAAALSMLHEYDLECRVLRTLLAQRRWRRGKRGAWYDRLALVLMNHYNNTAEMKEEKCREATQVCIDGLLDEETHMIYRPALSRRLTRLERKLQLPADECHISYASLMTCETRELAAPRIPDNMGRPKVRRDTSAGARAEEREREASVGLGMEVDDGTGRGGVQQTGKSVWAGRDGEVTVEGWVLEWWEAKGYKGFHSESSILTTLFTLLFWPVLFHPIPGAFETPYQTAPLDLGEDTFAPSRAELFDAQLQKISTTAGALEVLAETDARERERGTWAVGVNWEYGRDDLREIVSALGGEGVQGVCRMLGEEYRHRVSGVPDLIVWDPASADVRFVEVKGPGDQLSETQKVWIDVLLSSGIQVEVCRVRAVEMGKEGVEKAKKAWADRAQRAERMSRTGGAGTTEEDKAEWKDEYEAERKDRGGTGLLRRVQRGAREEMNEKDEDQEDEEMRREEEGEGWEGVEEAKRAVGR